MYGSKMIGGSMNIWDFHRNYREMFRVYTDEMYTPVKLQIRDGEALWGDYLEELMDWLVGEDSEGRLKLERVACDEINRGFTFEAVSKDGTRWKSEAVDCHKFKSGAVVGRFPDKSGRLVLAIRK